jgi:hypothetical protein
LLHFFAPPTPAYVSIRQHTPAYVSIRLRVQLLLLYGPPTLPLPAFVSFFCPVLMLEQLFRLYSGSIVEPSLL